MGVAPHSGRVRRALLALVSFFIPLLLLVHTLSLIKFRVTDGVACSKLLSYNHFLYDGERAFADAVARDVPLDCTCGDAFSATPLSSDGEYTSFGNACGDLLARRGIFERVGITVSKRRLLRRPDAPGNFLSMAFVAYQPGMSATAVRRAIHEAIQRELAARESSGIVVVHLGRVVNVTSITQFRLPSKVRYIHPTGEACSIADTRVSPCSIVLALHPRLGWYVHGARKAGRG